jgi:hypothetical protein
VEKDRSPQKACRNCGGSRDCPRSGICKACYNAGRKRRYAEDFRYRAKILKKRAEYVDRNRETINAKAKERYQDPEARLVILARHRRWLSGAREDYNSKRRIKWRDDPTYRRRLQEGHQRWWCFAKDKANERRREMTRTDQAYRARTRSWHLKRYGLTTGEYEALCSQNGGKCWICGAVPRRRLAVDHDHTTGIVRGVLCVNCNHGLGKFRDNPGLLIKAAGYLRAPAPKLCGR